MNGRLPPGPGRSVIGASAALIACLGLISGCGDSSEQRLMAAELAEGCSINSDCLEPYVCVFEYCREACEEDRDCAPEQACVRSDRHGVNVCQPALSPAPCEGGGDCSPEGTNAQSGEGVGVRVTPRIGRIRDVQLQSERAVAVTSAGSETTVESSGDPMRADEEPAFIYDETSGAAEAPNAAPDAIPIPSAGSVAINLPADDQDWFAIEVPDDGRAHVIDIAIGSSPTLGVTLTAVAARDFSVIGSEAVPHGADGKVHVSVGPGTSTLIGCQNRAGDGQAQLTLRTLDEMDEHEPNNVSADAAPIDLDTTIRAQFMRPYTASEGVTRDVADDWYAVELAAGTATLSLLGSPKSGRFNVSWTRPALGDGPIAVAAAPGWVGNAEFDVPESGTYFIRFWPYSGFSAFAAGDKPPHLAQSYRFRVTQGASLE